MTQPAIKVDRVWKEYVVGRPQSTHGTFYDLLSSAMTTPLKRLRELRGHGSEAERFWALRDVSFETQPGEVVGVVGRNGAGKSTLLKTLSRITAPTRGTLTIVGRLASLLEVGTGFHPDLTGRENIFLNGAILGMSRREMVSRFDEIVAFAEVEDFIDTPVKRYSSGMYMRLAFAVAAHLETDVLLVDEVLAVGDAAFQRKSLGKMGEVAKVGRTVFLVSHNLAAIRNLSSRVLVFERGALAFDGPVGEGLSLYERSWTVPAQTLEEASFHGSLSGDVRFDRLTYRQAGTIVTIVDPQCDFQIELHGHANQTFPRLNLKLGVYRDGVFLASCHDAEPDAAMREGRFSSVFDLPGKVFRPGRYTLGVGASASMGSWIWGTDVAVLDFSENRAGLPSDRSEGLLAIPYAGHRTDGL
jgi:ABC-type polysaccharide/polyol phosphate transport system ATPase subunit